MLQLNIFENIRKDIEKNVDVKKFINELSSFLNNITTFKTQKNINFKKEVTLNIETPTQDHVVSLDETNPKLKEWRKEGHLYLVTEDRNNIAYLWDFTDKPEYEFKEIILSEEMLNIAKEGAMLQYINGKYELYSPYGYNMLFNENK